MSSEPIAWNLDGTVWLIENDWAGSVLCCRCSTLLWVCDSCNDYQCACPLPWADQVKKADRKIMPNQHYDKDYIPYTKNPFEGAEDESIV